MTAELICGDCCQVLEHLPGVDCIFADPPDNIGLGYATYRDRLAVEDYVRLLERWLRLFVRKAPVVWFSFNARWTCSVGQIACDLGVEVKPCVQIYTFGQHNHRDLGNCYRPLWRFSTPGVPLYPEQIRVPSWRQLNGDKRADPRGRVPSDVFDIPRVTGNSKQRRRWHPTQLHEGLVERCIRLVTPDDQPCKVLDPFGGTGTTLRVCNRIGRDCTLVEIDRGYCEQIAQEHSLKICEPV